MSKIKDDIKRANYLIKIPSFFRENDDIFDMIYPFTTENINGMFSHFSFKDKDCLSVLGSSDQVFDMYLRGAKSVTAFDINPLNTIYEDLAKKYNCYFLNNDGLDVGIDGVHLTEESHKKLAELLYNKIKDIYTN